MLVEAGGYDDLVNRTEYLNRIHGLDEAIVGRVRDLRDQVSAPSSGCARRSSGSKPPATRSPPKSRRWPVRGRRCRSARRARLRPATREAALEKIDRVEEDLEGDVAEIQGELAATLESTSSAPLPAGPIRYGSGS